MSMTKLQQTVERVIAKAEHDENRRDGVKLCRVFVFDSRNTGKYAYTTSSILLAMDYARKQEHARIERGEGVWG